MSPAPTTIKHGGAACLEVTEDLNNNACNLSRALVVVDVAFWVLITTDKVPTSSLALV